MLLHFASCPSLGDAPDKLRLRQSDFGNLPEIVRVNDLKKEQSKITENALQIFQSHFGLEVDYIPREARLPVWVEEYKVSCTAANSVKP